MQIVVSHPVAAGPLAPPHGAKWNGHTCSNVAPSPSLLDQDGAAEETGSVTPNSDGEEDDTDYYCKGDFWGFLV